MTYYAYIVLFFEKTFYLSIEMLSSLYLSDIISKFCTVVISVIVNLHAVFHFSHATSQWRPSLLHPERSWDPSSYWMPNDPFRNSVAIYLNI
jgi:hypothetical protein